MFSGELLVFCDGPDGDKPAECRQADHTATSGQSIVTITAHSPGLHSLHVRYNDINVPGKYPAKKLRKALNPLHTFPRNTVDAEVANLLRTCCGLVSDTANKSVTTWQQICCAVPL